MVIPNSQFSKSFQDATRDIRTTGVKDGSVIRKGKVSQPRVLDISVKRSPAPIAALKTL
jgi:hypothetical protein